MAVRAVLTLTVVLCALVVVPAPAGAQAVPKIVFASDRDGTYDIWTMNPDGSGQVKLAGTPTADEFSPVASADGTKIAFIRGLGALGGEPEGDLMIMSSDGTGERSVTFGANDPAWSPGGDRLAFGSIGHSSRDGELWRINADGSGATALAAPSRDNLGTSWSADGQRIAFHAQISDPPIPNRDGIWTVKPDGTGLTQLTDVEESGDANPDWSPDGAKIAFDHFGSIWSMNANATGKTQLTPSGVEPAWSLDGSQIAFAGFGGGDYEIYRVNPDGSGLTPLTADPASDIDPDWLPVYPGYARPKGATPFRVALSTAYRQCTSPNRTHGPPLAFPSCSGPQQVSDYLTVGTGDSNGLPARNEGYVLLGAVLGNPSTPADEADVRIESFMDDVFTKPALADYTGELHIRLAIRLTDRDNPGPAPTTGTTPDFPLEFDMPCTAVADPQEGSSCATATTIEAIIPGAVKEGKRAIWALSRVELYDGGADGAGQTTGDNTLLATQGLFIP